MCVLGTGATASSAAFRSSLHVNRGDEVYFICVLGGCVCVRLCCCERKEILFFGFLITFLDLSLSHALSSSSSTFVS